jgi:hypothetical protein
MKTTKIILKNITAIGNKATTFRGDVQVSACDIALHVLKFGEVSLAGKLLAAVGSGSNKEALARWLATHAFCRMKDGVLVINKEARKDALKGFVNDDEAVEAYEIAITLAPAWHVDPEQEERVKKVFDSFEAADNLIKKMLAKGDAQLASKLAGVVAEYKKAMTG